MPVYTVPLVGGGSVALDLDDLSDNEVLQTLEGVQYLLTPDGKLLLLSTVIDLAVESAVAQLPAPDVVGLFPSEPFDALKSYPPYSVVEVTLSDSRIGTYWTTEDVAVGTAPPTAPWRPLAIPAPAPAPSGGGGTGAVFNLRQSTQPAGGVTVDLALQAHYYIAQDANKPTTITGYGKGGFAVLTFYAPGSGTGYQPDVRSGTGGTVTLQQAPNLDLTQKGRGKTYIVRSHSTSSAVLSTDTNDSPVAVEAAVISQHPNTVATYEFNAASLPLGNVVTPGSFGFDPASGTYTQVTPMGLSFASGVATDSLGTSLFAGDFELPWALTIVLVNAHTWAFGSDIFGFGQRTGQGSYNGHIRGRFFQNASTTDRYVGLNVNEPNAGLTTGNTLSNTDGNFVGTRVDPARVLNPILLSYEGSGLWQIYNLATGATLVQVSNGTTAANKRYIGASATNYPNYNAQLALSIAATMQGGNRLGRVASEFKHIQMAFGLPAGALSNANLKAFFDVAKEAIARIDPSGPQLGTSAF